MAIHITDPETDAAVRKLAALKRVTLTEAIREACAREAAEIETDRVRREEEVRAILAEIDSWPKTGLKADKAFFDSLSGDD